MYNEATNFEILHFDEHLQDKNLQVNQAVSLQMNILAWRSLVTYSTLAKRIQSLDSRI